MRGRHLVAALAAVLPRIAAAESHKLLVLQSEGRADADLRAKIDAAITRLAIAAEPQASAGGLTFSDAATAVGCKPDAPSCKDEVLDMLAVDELVITTVTPGPGGVEIAVHRVGKHGTSRDATMVLAAGAPPDTLDGIAPVFSRPPAPPAGPAAPTPPRAITPSAPAGGERPALPAPTAVAAPPRPVPEAPPPPAGPTAARPVDPPGAHGRRLELAGMAGGAGMVVVGLVLWGAASGVQDDIDHAPTMTRQDLADLRDLEAKGDTYATLGNVLTAGGLVVGGVATYLYLRDRRAASTASTRLLPTVFDHGAGIVLTIGGLP